MVLNNEVGYGHTRYQIPRMVRSSETVYTMGWLCQWSNIGVLDMLVNSHKCLSITGRTSILIFCIFSSSYCWTAYGRVGVILSSIFPSRRCTCLFLLLLLSFSSFQWAWSLDWIHSTFYGVYAVRCAFSFFRCIVASDRHLYAYILFRFQSSSLFRYFPRD